MGFKAKPNRFELSVAPTSRARCRVCKRTVEKGETRLVTFAFVKPGRGTRFVRHLTCVTAALMREVVAAHGSVERVPVEIGMDAERANEARMEVGTEACVWMKMLVDHCRKSTAVRVYRRAARGAAYSRTTVVARRP